MATNYHECNSIFYERACDLFGEMKQQQIADMTGLAQGKVSDILSQGKFGSNPNKKPSAETVYKIAKAFNVSTDYLLGLTDYKTDSKATRELCSTLGLSEEAVKILSADDTSIIAKQWKDLLSTEPFEDFGHTEEECKEIRKGELSIMIDGSAFEVAFVINRLLDDFIKAQAIKTQHADYDYYWSDESLIELLADFYDCTDTAVFETRINGQSITLPSEVFLSSITKEGKKCYPIGVKELLIDSYIGKITTRLQHIKQREFLDD